MRIPYGVNRRALDRILLRFGGTVADVRRTGEVRYSHPFVEAKPRANKRRKDAPNHLVDFVRAVVSAGRASGGSHEPVGTETGSHRTK